MSYIEDLEKRVEELEYTVAEKDKQIDGCHRAITNLYFPLDPLQQDRVLKTCKNPLCPSTEEMRKAFSTFFEIDWNIPEHVVDEDDEYIWKTTSLD